MLECSLAGGIVLPERIHCTGEKYIAKTDIKEEFAEQLNAFDKIGNVGC